MYFYVCVLCCIIIHRDIQSREKIMIVLNCGRKTQRNRTEEKEYNVTSVHKRTKR